MYTVKEVAELAAVSVRTLHYYDEIDLLKPTHVAENGYRYYDEAALLRLQQILLYREIGMALAEISEILDQPDFDIVAALRNHRATLRQKMQRNRELIQTVDRTIAHLSGEDHMSDEEIFQGFDEEQQKEYEREARLTYGPDQVNESIQRWNSYSKAQQETIMQEGNQIYQQLADALQAGTSPNDAQVQAILVRWHNHLRYFYEPSLDLLRGLGMLYNSDVRFMENFQKLHPDLPQYLEDSIDVYVDDLETAEIERMLAEEEQGHKRA